MPNFIQNGKITNTSLEVVISNKKDAYALTRAKDNGIQAIYGPKADVLKSEIQDILGL